MTDADLPLLLDGEQRDHWRDGWGDQDPENRRVVQAYHKTGFRPVPELEGRTGNCLIMRHKEDSPE